MQNCDVEMRNDSNYSQWPLILLQKKGTAPAAGANDKGGNKGADKGGKKGDFQ